MVLVFVMPIYTLANCTFNTYEMNLTANINVANDTPVGTQIASLAGSSMESFARCYFTSRRTIGTFMETGATNTGMTVGSTGAGSGTVYATNVPGVGVAILFNSKITRNNSGKSSWGVAYPYPATFLQGNGSTSTTTWRTPSRDNYLVALLANIWLIKTGPITNGNLNGFTLGQVGFSVNGTNLSGRGNVIISGNVNVFNTSCRVNTPTLRFNLGSIPLTRFGTNPGTLPGGAENTQRLSLDCDPGINISATLQGAQNPDSSDTTVLALAHQGQTGVAQGVGVQLLYNNQPMVLSQPVALHRSTGGMIELPISARYIQTLPAPTTGTANTNATLVITYQ